MADIGPVIVIHGGAWGIPDHLAVVSVEGVKRAARKGYELLKAGETAVDAVEAAVIVLENDPAFDAGTGSVLNQKREVEMDAIIMDGKSLKTGAVAAVQNITNPVSLARKVMEQTDHCMLVGTGANEFAREVGIAEVSSDQLVTEEAKKEYEELMKYKNTINRRFSLQSSQSKKSSKLSHDTVGAVALDRHGDVACATSTGGITAKQPGRVGDSPLIGSGAYADSNTGAVSTTGHGEAIMKVCLSHHIIMKMQQGTGCQKAADESLSMMEHRVQGTGGAICVSKTGEIAQAFNTERMAWAAVKNDTLHYGLNPGEHRTETLLNK